MKNYYLALFVFAVSALSAQQNQYGVLYNILNTKCQNGSCHSAASSDYLKFDGDSDAVYAAIFNVLPANATSIANHEMLVNPEMPYASFLLRKIASAGFDTDLALDSTEGNLMNDVNGTKLSNVEIEYFRQWIRYGALKSYTTGSTQIAQPDFPTVLQYYTDTVTTPFLQKPTKPDPSKGIQLRMGPMFLPVTGAVEQEVTEQNVVYFPYLPEITEVDGIMTEQSHHFLLFEFPDSLDARDPSYKAQDISDIAQVTPAIGGAEPFGANKNLVGAWQTDANAVLPAGTALMWDQKAFLDMDFHVRNYNATSVLPCDFYFNVYFKPRDSTTIPMISKLVNNIAFGNTRGCPDWDLQSLPQNEAYADTFKEPDNNTAELRYIWMTAGHTHQWGTGFQILRVNESGQYSNLIYNGDSDYVNAVNTGAWDWHHPPIEYFPSLLPVQFGVGGSGLAAATTWMSDSSCVHFGFTTSDEMMLYYYMYTTQLPPAVPAAVSPVAPPALYFEVAPNPMGSSNGKLIYSLDKPAQIQASIIDITGKTIASLAHENEDSGLHEISLAGNGTIASGIYFARLVVNGNLYTRKFVITE